MNTAQKMIRTAFIYTLLAMAGGVFYREYTKFQGFTGETNLSVIHTHLFLLGMIFFLVAALFSLHGALEEQKRFRLFYIIYNVGITLTTITFLWRGLVQVQGVVLSRGMDASISGIAGIGHICIGVGMVIFFGIIKKGCEISS